MIRATMHAGILRTCLLTVTALTLSAATLSPVVNLQVPNAFDEQVLEMAGTRWHRMTLSPWAIQCGGIARLRFLANSYGAGTASPSYLAFPGANPSCSASLEAPTGDVVIYRTGTDGGQPRARYRQLVQRGVWAGVDIIYEADEQGIAVTFRLERATLLPLIRLQTALVRPYTALAWPAGPITASTANGAPVPLEMNANTGDIGSIQTWSATAPTAAPFQPLRVHMRLDSPAFRFFSLVTPLPDGGFAAAAGVISALDGSPLCPRRLGYVDTCAQTLAAAFSPNGQLRFSSILVSPEGPNWPQHLQATAEGDIQILGYAHGSLAATQGAVVQAPRGLEVFAARLHGSTGTVMQIARFGTEFDDSVSAWATDNAGNLLISMRGSRGNPIPGIQYTCTHVVRLSADYRSLSDSGCVDGTVAGIHPLPDGSIVLTKNAMSEREITTDAPWPGPAGSNSGVGIQKIDLVRGRALFGTYVPRLIHHSSSIRESDGAIWLSGVATGEGQLQPLLVRVDAGQGNLRIAPAPMAGQLTRLPDGTLMILSTENQRIDPSPEAILRSVCEPNIMLMRFDPSTDRTLLTTYLPIWAQWAGFTASDDPLLLLNGTISRLHWNAPSKPALACWTTGEAARAGGLIRLVGTKLDPPGTAVTVSIDNRIAPIAASNPDRLLVSVPISLVKANGPPRTVPVAVRHNGAVVAEASLVLTAPRLGTLEVGWPGLETRNGDGSINGFSNPAAPGTRFRLYLSAVETPPAQPVLRVGALPAALLRWENAPEWSGGIRVLEGRVPAGVGSGLTAMWLDNEWVGNLYVSSAIN